MIIDKEGRLFGKLSIVDLVTLVGFLLLGLVFFKQLGVLNDNQASASLDEIQLVFYQEEVNDFTAQAVKPGDPAKETLKNVSFGHVEKVDIGESISWDKDPDGKQVASSRSGYNSIHVTTLAQGRLTNNGVILDGEHYYVGQTIVFKVGNAMFYGDIASIKKI